MRRLVKLLIPISITAMSGCVVAPYGYYHRGLRPACGGGAAGARRGRAAVVVWPYR
jgi:hypothetical protein